jgi:hypothetical protein
MGYHHPEGMQHIFDAVEGENWVIFMRWRKGKGEDAKRVQNE